MDLFAQHTRLFFRMTSALTTVILCALIVTSLSGCLDIPNAPSDDRKIESISVYIEQKGIHDSLDLKMHPSDSATLNVLVQPQKFKNELSFEWLRQSPIKNDSSSFTSLGSGTKYGISPNTPSLFIPDLLVATDKRGNRKEINIHVILNARPQMDSVTVPAAGDTLYGDVNTSFLFKWNSSDPDDFNEGLPSYRVIFDDTAFELGNLNNIYQAGFLPGKHTFSIIVTDAYGDSDTLPARKFYVLDTLGDTDK